MSTPYSTFGTFLLLKQKSQDGIGTLWRAGEMEQSGFRRITWLRCFDQAGLDRAAMEAELPLTAQLGQALKATNVVRSVVAASEGGVPFLAWDYVPAQPLDQVLSRVAQEQFPVAIDNALLITEKLTSALAAALAVEVRGEPLVHGFLVPHLVMVGNDGEAYVAGFGLARGFLANLDRVAVNEAAAPYLAPEVLSSHQPSRRGDVYSIGAVLYQLLTGQPLPVEPLARANALQQPRMAFEDTAIPDDVAAILRKALATRPEDRYPSAADFKRDLEKLLYGGAYSPTTFNLALFMDRLYRHEIEEEDRELQRERGIDVTPYYRAPGQAGPVAPPPSSGRNVLYIALGSVAVLLAVIGYLLFGRPAPPQVDQAAQTRILQELVAQEMAKREAELRQAYDQSRQEIDNLRKQLDSQQKASGAVGKKLSAEEQKRIDDAQRELAAREAEQRKREQELAKIREDRAKAQASAPVVVQSTAVPVPTAAPQVQVLPTAVPPTPAPLVQATEAPVAAPTAVAAAASGSGLGVGIREGDYVPFAQLDVQPQELVTAKPELPRAAVMARAGKGVVILRAKVNERGSVDGVDILRGFPTARLGIDEACVEAVKQYRYRPGMKGGVKVKTDVTVTMPIDLTKTR